MYRHLIQGISLALLIAGARCAGAANLIANSEFDTDLSGWTVLLGNAAWSADDCCGNSASGSASMRLIDTGQSLIASDCVDVQPGAAYDLVLFAETLPIPPGFLGGHGTAVVEWVRTGEVCQSAQGASGQSSIDVSGADGWRSFGITVTAPADAVAARVALGAGIAGLSVAIDMHFDHVLFGPTGTVPVTLQSFLVD